MKDTMGAQNQQDLVPAYWVRNILNEKHDSVVTLCMSVCCGSLFIKTGIRNSVFNNNNNAAVYRCTEI